MATAAAIALNVSAPAFAETKYSWEETIAKAVAYEADTGRKGGWVRGLHTTKSFKRLHGNSGYLFGNVLGNDVVLPFITDISAISEAAKLSQRPIIVASNEWILPSNSMMCEAAGQAGMTCVKFTELFYRNSTLDAEGNVDPRGAVVKLEELQANVIAYVDSMGLTLAADNSEVVVNLQDVIDGLQSDKAVNAVSIAALEAQVASLIADETISAANIAQLNADLAAKIEFNEELVAALEAETEAKDILTGHYHAAQNTITELKHNITVLQGNLDSAMVANKAQVDLLNGVRIVLEEKVAGLKASLMASEANNASLTLTNSKLSIDLSESQIALTEVQNQLDNAMIVSKGWEDKSVELQGMLDTANTTIATLTSDNAELTASYKEVADQIVGFEAQVAELTQGVKDAKAASVADKAALVNAVEAHNVAVQDHNDLVDGLNADIVELNKTISNNLQMHNAKVLELNTAHEVAITDLTSHYDGVISNYDEALVELIEDHNDTINELTNSHTIAISNLKADHDTAIADLIYDHAQDIASLTAEFKIDLDAAIAGVTIEQAIINAPAWDSAANLDSKDFYEFSVNAKGYIFFNDETEVGKTGLSYENGKDTGYSNGFAAGKAAGLTEQFPEFAEVISLQSEIETLEAQVTTGNAKITSLEGQLSAAKTELSAAISSHAVAIADLESVHSDALTEATELANGLKSDITALNTEISGLESDLSSAYKTISDNTDTYNALVTKYDALVVDYDVLSNSSESYDNGFLAGEIAANLISGVKISDLIDEAAQLTLVHDEAIAKLNSEHAIAITNAVADKVTELNTAHGLAIDALEESHTIAMTNLVNTHNSTVTSLNNQITALQNNNIAVVPNDNGDYQVGFDAAIEELKIEGSLLLSSNGTITYSPIVGDDVELQQLNHASYDLGYLNGKQAGKASVEVDVAKNLLHGTNGVKVHKNGSVTYIDTVFSEAKQPRTLKSTNNSWNNGYDAGLADGTGYTFTDLQAGIGISKSGKISLNLDNESITIITLPGSSYDKGHQVGYDAGYIDGENAGIFEGYANGYKHGGVDLLNDVEDTFNLLKNGKVIANVTVKGILKEVELGQQYNDSYDKGKQVGWNKGYAKGYADKSAGLPSNNTPDHTYDD